MKKTLALLLALMMAITLFASCDKETTTATSPTPTAADTATAEPGDTTTPEASESTAPTQPSENDTGSDPLDKVGFYDPDYDYTQNKKFKVGYMVVGNPTVFNNDFHAAFKHWASLSNIDYSNEIIVAADNDAYLTQLRALKEQGYDGLLLDPDMMIYSQINEVCNEIGLLWMGGMGQAMNYKEDGTPDGLIHPYVGFDHLTYGVECGNKLLEHASTTWPDVSLDEIGFLSVDMALSPPLHQRVEGAQQAWTAAGVPTGNQYIVDVAGMMTLDAAQQAVEGFLPSHPEFEYWLILGVIDDFAQGAANALANVGLENTACVVTVGGTMLRQNWDAGVQNAWKFAYTTPNTMYGEPIFFALYAFMSGQATPETIWPSWINHSPDVVPYFGETYAQLLLPSYWMEYDSYKKLLAWADVYAGANTYGYDQTGITRDDYPARVAVPDYYKG